MLRAISNWLWSERQRTEYNMRARYHIIAYECVCVWCACVYDPISSTCVTMCMEIYILIFNYFSAHGIRIFELISYVGRRRSEPIFVCEFVNERLRTPHTQRHNWDPPNITKCEWIIICGFGNYLRFVCLCSENRDCFDCGRLHKVSAVNLTI